MISDQQDNGSSLRPSKSSLLKNCFYLLIVLTALILSVGFLCRHYGHQTNLSIIENKMHALFSSKQYKKIFQELNKKQSKYQILVGKKIDGVHLFVQKFINKKLDEGYHIKLREYQEGSDLQFHNHQFFTLGNQFINKYIIQEKNHTNNYWIIFTKQQLNQTAYAQINQIDSQNKNDKFLIISQTDIKKKGFNKVTFKRPSDEAIEQYLESLSLSPLAIKNILTYHQNDLEHISHLINQVDPLKSFNYYFVQQIQKIQQLISNSTKPKKIESILTQICQQGKFKSKKQLQFIKNNNVISFNQGAYYWTQIKYIYAFSIIKDQECIMNVQFHQTPMTQLAEVSQPQSPKQSKQQVKQNKSEAKQGKKKGKKGDKNKN